MSAYAMNLIAKDMNILDLSIISLQKSIENNIIRQNIFSKSVDCKMSDIMLKKGKKRKKKFAKIIFENSQKIDWLSIMLIKVNFCFFKILVFFLILF